MTFGEEWYVRKLVRNILSRGYTISVNDGEEWTLVDNRHEDQIMAALGTTDEDFIKMKDPLDYKSLGVFSLIYGNDPEGEEVVSDYTSNRLCETIWREVFGWPMEDQLEFIISDETK